MPSNLLPHGAGILGTSPTLVIRDERASWPEPKGSRLEPALLTGSLKRSGKGLVISTRAANDPHPFSRRRDEDPPSTYRQEHRLTPGLEPEDPAAITAANPGIAAGIAPPLKELQAAARRAKVRGGADLPAFWLLHLNERVQDATNEPLVSLTIGSPAKPMTCPSGPGRLETHGWFPSRPGLRDRGRAVVEATEGYPIAAICYDSFTRSEVGDGLRAADVTARQVLRRFGPFDGGEDAERFRRAVHDRHIAAPETLLMRSALSEAVCRRDAQLNPCLDKGRSTGRIDAVSAAVPAVGEGSRIVGRGPVRPRVVAWARCIIAILRL